MPAKQSARHSRYLNKILKHSNRRSRQTDKLHTQHVRCLDTHTNCLGRQTDSSDTLITVKTLISWSEQQNRLSVYPDRKSTLTVWTSQEQDGQSAARLTVQTPYHLGWQKIILTKLYQNVWKTSMKLFKIV